MPQRRMYDLWPARSNQQGECKRRVRQGRWIRHGGGKTGCRPWGLRFQSPPSIVSESNLSCHPRKRPPSLPLSPCHRPLFPPPPKKKNQKSKREQKGKKEKCLHCFVVWDVMATTTITYTDHKYLWQFLVWNSWLVFSQSDHWNTTVSYSDALYSVL